MSYMANKYCIVLYNRFQALAGMEDLMQSETHDALRCKRAESLKPHVRHHYQADPEETGM